MSRALLLLVWLIAAGAPTRVCAANVSDSAGSRLMKTWKGARRKYADALLISISGRTASDGAPVCDPTDPFRNGWRLTFYSPKAKEFIMMAECGGETAGPLVQMRGRGASTFSIEGKFIDSDVALKTLEKAGVSLDPARHDMRGQRPFNLKLYRLKDDRFETHPVVWKIRIGKSSYLIDADKNEMFSPKRYGVSLSGDVSQETLGKDALSKRPKHTNVYTVRKDFDAVIRYAENRFGKAHLMGIEGFADSWGGAPCTGAGDGWAYYFYIPKTRGLEAMYACRGSIGPGPSQYLPIDLNVHEAITEHFVDSSHVMDTLITKHPSVMNEGMGRDFTRNARLLLLRFRSSPIRRADAWDARFVWRVAVGRTQYRFDAKTGQFIDASQ